MTDVHCHVSSGDQAVREFAIGRDFFGVHPWDADDIGRLGGLRERLLANPSSGVGEIGLDRLRAREIPAVMREVFRAQLDLAVELNRVVVLHGAKCWGRVVEEVKGRGIAALLFHGFSRSDGLIADIVALNGFISIGPSVLNDHAVNYRDLVKKIPLDRILVETDRTEKNAATCPPVCDVLAKVAELRGIDADGLERITDDNATRFMEGKV